MHMKSHRTPCFVALCLAGSAIAAPAIASANTPDVAPPMPRVELVAPRDGFVWASGYWEWYGHSYHWVTGTYIYERRRQRWIADQWEQANGRWQHLHGRWERVEARARLLSSAETPAKTR
jgi:hypothetical protein